MSAASALPFTITDVPRHPQVWLTEFGNSALCYELIVWVEGDAISRPDAIVAAYNWAIESALAEAGIEIPFPQQDLHVRSYFGLRGEDALGILHGQRKVGGVVRKTRSAVSSESSAQHDSSGLLLDNDAAEDTLEGMAQARREKEESEESIVESNIETNA